MYLIVITKKKKVGDLLGHAVWKTLDCEVISYKKTVLHLTDNQVKYKLQTPLRLAQVVGRWEETEQITMGICSS